MMPVVFGQFRRLPVRLTFLQSGFTFPEMVVLL